VALVEVNFELIEEAKVGLQEAGRRLARYRRASEESSDLRQGRVASSGIRYLDCQAYCWYRGF